MRQQNPRMDIASRERMEKESLFRLVPVEGVLTLDEEGTLPGRGVYLAKRRESIELARRRRMLSRYGRILDEEAFFAELERRIPR